MQNSHQSPSDPFLHVFFTCCSTKCFFVFFRAIYGCLRIGVMGVLLSVGVRDTHTYTWIQQTGSPCQYLIHVVKHLNRAPVYLQKHCATMSCKFDKGRKATTPFRTQLELLTKSKETFFNPVYLYYITLFVLNYIMQS